MNAFVVDTNVAVVANGRETHASDRCQYSCIEKLENIVDGGLIVIDDANFIMTEYERRLHFQGAPGVGDMFYRHVFDNQYITAKVQRVLIHSTADGSFQEFPNDPSLNGFDPDDHMFVAVALESSRNPKILNAVDNDWKQFQTKLMNHGLVVVQLCPEELRG